MITNCVKLHSSFLEHEANQIGYVFNSKDNDNPLVKQMNFGNQFYWNRDYLWKIIERLPIVQKEESVVEHIVEILPDKHIYPIISKYFNSGSIAVYNHTYRSGTKALKYLSDQISHGASCSASFDPVSTVICPTLLGLYLSCGPYNKIYPYVNYWLKKNPEVNNISPVRDFWGRNTDNEFQLEDFYLPITQPSNKFWCYKGRLLSNGGAISIYDTNLIAKDLADTLEEAYREVAHGNYDESLMTDILTDTIAPWKREIYRNLDCNELNPHLGSMQSFINGELTIDKLAKLTSADAFNENQIFTIQDVSQIKDVNEYVTKFHVEQIEYTKEFASVIEYIQSLALTDFCFMYDIQMFSMNKYDPEIIFIMNRYHPIDTIGRLYPYVKDTNAEYKFKDRTEDLGQLLCNWLCTSYTDILGNYSRLKIIKTYNEELFFYFDNTPIYADTKLMYYDLVGGIVCGRHMCNVIEN